MDLAYANSSISNSLNLAEQDSSQNSNWETVIMEPEVLLNTSSTDLPYPQPETPRQPADNDDEEASDDVIILCLLWDKGKLGAAYYNLQAAQISVLADTVDWSPHFHVTKSLYRQILPQKVISINRMTDSFVKAVVSAITDSEVNLVEKLPESLQLVTRKAYLYDTCKRRVLSVKLVTEPNNLSDEERRKFLQSTLDFSDEVMIHALGILLMYIDKYWGFLQNNTEYPTPRFYSINIMSLRNLVLIDDETYKALQILSPMDHFKKGGGGFDKQRPSLLGLFKCCRTSLGARKLREFFVHPTNDRTILENRHNVILFFMDPNNEDILKGISDCMRHITNLNPIFTKLTGLTAKTPQWKIFHKALCSCVIIGELLRSYSDVSALFHEISSFDASILHVASCVEEVIDLSSDNANVSINSGIDPDLDLKKNKVKKIDVIINAVARQEMNQLPEFIMECRICYITEMGYILEVKKWKDSLTPNEISSVGFKLLFCTGTHVIFKSPSCIELDNELGDVLLEILSHEVRIVVRLVQFMEKHFPHIQNQLNLIGELDGLMAMANVALELDLVRPEITEDRVISIKEGRHPLLEIFTSSYVPNDYQSSLEDGFVKIITGANASGKSVYMKQTALIAFMVHIGSFVPANSVRMCLLNNIHTRIKTLESVSTEASTFLIDLRQMAHAMFSATNKSLIIIDEFGNGTTELDAVALLTASLEGFTENVELCPHILVSTHYTKLATVLEPSPLIKYQMTEHTFDTLGRLIFLYKIIDGQSRSSHAISVAETEQLPTAVLTRMRQILPSIRDGAPLPPPLLQPRVQQRLRRFAEHAAIFTTANLDDLNMADLNQLFGDQAAAGETSPSS